MGQSISALIVAALIIVSGVVMAGVTSTAIDKVDQSWRQMELLAEERLGTQLTLVSTEVSGGGVTVKMVFRNAGRTPIREPLRMDLIANYQSPSNQRVIRWLPYASVLADNTWTIESIAGADSHELFVVDSVTPLLFQLDARYVLNFLATCKDMADLGRTIIVTLHSYAVNQSLRLRAGSIVDAHLRLRIEELGNQLVRTLEINKVRGAVKTADNEVSFTVAAGLGLKSVPISRVRV